MSAQARLMDFPKHDRILIVGDGPSATPLRSMAIPRSIYVIAVNGAVRWINRVDAFFTLDPSLRNQYLMRNKRAGVQYFAAVPADFGTDNAKCKNHRGKGALSPGVTYLQRISGKGPHSARFGVSRLGHGVHSGNSAWGALGLAEKMRPKRVGLIGVDGNRARRVSGGQAGRLDHLPGLFASYDGSAQIVNGSHISVIDCFPRMPVDRMLKWLA